MRKIEYAPRWELYENRAPWSWLSVKETAALLGITIQSVHNHSSRGHLPPLEKRPGFRVGNKRFFHLGKLRSFLEKRPVEAIYDEFIHRIFPGENMTHAQAQYTVKICYNILGLERP